VWCVAFVKDCPAVVLTPQKHLEYAITRGDLAAAKSALELGADANGVGDMGYPMAAWAVVCGAQLEMIELLERGGADLEACAKDKTRTGLAELSVAFCRPDVVALLADRGFFEVNAEAYCGVPVGAVWGVGKAPERSKMNRMITSLKLGSSIMGAMGPIEEAFSGFAPTPKSDLQPL
jgi:hypothetical protein